MNVEIPDPPAMSCVTSEIIDAYYVIGRGRQFVGASCSPMPISVGMISEYLSVHQSSIDRREFDAVIFAIDDEFRAKWAQEADKPPKK